MLWVLYTETERKPAMDIQTTIGTALIAGAVVLITWLTIWSRKKIDDLARKNYPSARDAELRGDE